jgi:hypothetical protein
MMRKPTRKFFTVAGLTVLGVLVAFVAFGYVMHYRTTTRVQDEDNIRETVFNHQFLHNASGGQQRVSNFYISVENGDPSDDFLKRFQNRKPAVRKVSQLPSNADQDKKEIIEDVEDGVIFRITKIAWTDKNTVEVEGGYYESGLSASGNTYTVTYRFGKWVVTEDRMNWIS